MTLLILVVARPALAAGKMDGQQRDPEAVPEGMAKSDWHSIRAAYEAGRHAFQPIEGGWQARNPGQQWTTKFDARGFVTEPRDGEWQWGLELKSYGFGEKQRAIGGTLAVKADGQRLSYQWDENVQEWWVNDRRGLEHGFTVKERPADVSSLNSQPSTLNFTLAVRGSLVAQVGADGQGVEFRDAAGATVLTYAGLKVWDADGKALASRFAPAEKGVRLLVEERGARYPLTIDPIAQQARLSLGSSDSGFGNSVDVSGDTVVVGAWLDDSSTKGVNSTPNDNGANFDAGAAYVFVRSGTNWTQQAYLKASQVNALDYFGTSVAVSGDTVVVGAYGEDSSTTGVNSTPNENAAFAGAAYVFVRSGTNWTQQAYLKPAAVGTSQSGDGFGSSVAVSGNTVVVGAYGEDSSTTGVNSTPNENAGLAGAAYVFVRSGTNWTQQAYLKASQVDAGDDFGASVAVSGDTVVVGAHQEDSSTTGVNSTPNGSAVDSGAAYVFVRNGTNWTQQAYLKTSQVNSGDHFGGSVAVSGDTAVVGAYGDASSTTGVDSTPNESAAQAGAAYVFVRSGTNWTQQAYLKASQVNALDYFGISVAVSGDTVVVGAHREDSSTMGVNTTPNELATDSGAAYVFVRHGTNWRQQAYLKSNDTYENDWFGVAVAVSGDTVVVGQEDEFTANISRAYIFTGLGPATPAAMASTTGGWVNAGDFTVGTVGTTANANNWPAAQSPDKGTDNNLSTKYLNFKDANAALGLTPVNTSLAYNQLSFTTAEDAVERDPASYQIYGSAAPLPTTAGSNVPIAGLTLIASGALSLPDARNLGPTVVTFTNSTAYAAYLVVFPTVKNAAAANSTQIAEVELFFSDTEIAVFTGDNTGAANERTDNLGTNVFANTEVGSNSAAQTFTIQNFGAKDLTGLALSKTGENPADFTLSALGATTLAPSATTTFTVTFAPTAMGTRSAVVNIASNDDDENPFRINVRGLGKTEASALLEASFPGDAIVATSANSPVGYGAASAIDNDVTTKYLNFDKLNTGLTITPTGQRPVGALTLISAEDAPDRDPSSFVLEGSNNGTNFTRIASNAVAAFPTRHFIQAFTFPNTNVFTQYRVRFPTISNAAAADSMQIAEVELLYHGEITSTNDTVSITLPPGAVDVLGVGALFDRQLDDIRKLAVSPITNGNAIVTLTPAAGATVLKGFELIGAADDLTYPERRPSSVTVAGSMDGTNYTLLATMTPDVPSSNLQIQEFSTSSNTTAFARYRISFGPPIGGDTLQVGEMRLFGEPGNVLDASRPGDAIIATSANSPAGYGATNAIDNNATTKYLNFDKLNTGMTITPTSTRPVRALTLISAEDAPERDPSSFVLEGSNNGTNFTRIASNTVPAFPTRHYIQSIAITNTDVFNHYRVRFPTVSNAVAANSMQIAEVELLYHGEITSPSDPVSITLPPGAVDVRGVGSLIDRQLDGVHRLEVAPLTNSSTIVEIIPAAGARVLKGFELIGAADDFTFPQRRPSSVTVAGSNDGSNYTHLATVLPAPPSFNLQIQEFSTLSNNTAFARYRITFGPPVSGDRLQVGEMRLFGEVAAPPSLTIRASGANVLVSWPDSPGFMLETRADFNGPNWTPLVITPVLSNGVNTVTIPMGGATGFFRLRK